MPPQIIRIGKAKYYKGGFAMQLNINRCPGCMEPLSGNICPYCGYAADSPYMPEYLAPGVVLNNRYLTGKLLHHNGESAVYIGYDSANESKVFIKEYMPDTLCRRAENSSVITVNQNAVAQYKTFMSEFVELNKTLARLRNLSHINPAVDMFGDNNTGYVIFNYVEGKTLETVLAEKGGALSWDETRRLFSPLFTTLSLVHNAGLIHRGICPENLMITPKNELVMMGFCVADERTANTELHSEIYTGYAAPEQYSSGSWQGTWTDVYGISALLYRILTGTVPADASARLAGENIAEPIRLDPLIPSTVSDVIMHGLGLEREDRIQTITELVTGLFEDPEPQKSRTQAITIPKQQFAGISKPLIDDDDPSERFGRNSPAASEAASAKAAPSRPSRHAVFIMVALITAAVMIVLMAVLMMVLEDTTGTEKVTAPTGTLADIDNLAGALTYQTTPSVETESSQPTLNELENGSETSRRTGNVYIMNDLVGKTYDAIKNSPTYQSITFIPDYVYDEEQPKGVILGQSVAKGESYDEGAEVTVQISLGSKYVNIPDYEGLKSRAYFSLLDNAGIKYEEISYETKYYSTGYVCGISSEDDYVYDLSSGETLIVYVAYNPESETTAATTETETETTTEETTAETTTEETYETWEEITEYSEPEYTETEYIETEYTEPETDEFPDDIPVVSEIPDDMGFVDQTYIVPDDDDDDDIFEVSD